MRAFLAENFEKSYEENGDKEGYSYKPNEDDEILCNLVDRCLGVKACSLNNI